MKLYIFTLFMMISTLLAAPAFYGKRTFTQNDMSTFQGELKGDEYLHWIETNNEKIVIYNEKTQNHDYALIKNQQLLPSGQTFKPKQVRSISQSKTLSKEAVHKLWMEKRIKGYRNP